MSALLTRVRRSAAATFAVHCAGSVVAALAITPLATSIDLALAASDHDHASFLALATHVAGMDLARELRAGAVALLLFMLASPWLSLAWLCALDRADSIVDACARATPRARSAFVASASVWLAASACFAVILGLAWTAHHALAESNDVRLPDLAALLVAAPLPWLVLRALCALDLAHAAIATRDLGALQALRRAWHACTLVVMLERLGASLVCAGLPLLAWLASRALIQDVYLGHTSTLVLGQCAALLSTFVRAAWLSRALDHSEHYAEQPSPSNV